jgi:hypothetical protein
MTFINIVFTAIYCKMVGHLTNIYCLTVGHLIENLLKKSNAPPMPDPPPPLGLIIDRRITISLKFEPGQSRLGLTRVGDGWRSNASKSWNFHQFSSTLVFV